MKKNRLDETFGHNKLLLASLSAFLVGRLVNVKLRGTADQMKSVSEALIASKELHEELHRPGATVSSVMERLQRKRDAADHFEMQYGIKWPL